MIAFLNRLPVVTLLQAGAVLSLLAGLVITFVSWMNMVDAMDMGRVMFLTLSALIKILYQPLVLLGLAELIKTLQQGKTHNA